VTANIPDRTLKGILDVIKRCMNGADLVHARRDMLAGHRDDVTLTRAHKSVRDAHRPSRTVKKKP
jgi:hypothetical protein